MSMAHNPFYHRGPIREPIYFYNRQREIDQICNLIRTSQSVSVVGPRRIGKTSLLYYVLHPHTRAAHSLLPPQHVIVPIDMEGMEQASAAQVHALFVDGLQEVLRELSVNLEWMKSTGPVDYSLLDRAAKSVSRQGTRVTFFVDEFELLAVNPNLDPTFFSGLRGLATRYAISYVLASQRPLISLVYADDSVLSSPFFNIFATVPLGLFSESAARGMVLAFLKRAGTILPQQVLDAIVDLAGPHPFFVQVAAYQAFELAQSVERWDERALELLSESFYEEAQQHYLYYWYNLSEGERYALANLAVVQHDPSMRPTLRQLQRQCLIIPSNSGYRYLSSALRRFVRGQRVNNLLQIEPFVIDLQRHMVTVAGEPLKLTKTQFKILAYLAQRQGQVATNRELEEHVWQDEYVEDPQRLKAAIKHLRRALGPWARYIVNERGVGYALRVVGNSP